MPSRRLQPESTLLIEGPASFRLDEGEAFCLGAPLQRGSWISIREDHQFPIETSTDCLLDIGLGRGGKYRELKESTIPTGWREASQILAQAPGVAVILGDVDCGKSTLCTFLANESFNRGSKVTVIDGDVGQADLGPPTTISMTLLRMNVLSLQDLKPDTALFMGDTSPSFIAEKLSKGLLRLTEIAQSQSEIILVNTDGWVKGDEALRYKLQLLDRIKPTFIFGIDSDSDTNFIIQRQVSTSLKLSKSPYASTRTREDRKKAREYGYKRFMKNAEKLELPLRKVRLRRFNSYQQMKITENENLRGTLAGLLDEEERLLAISRVDSFRDGIVTVRTTLNNSPKIIELGAVILSPSYEELGYES